MIGNTISHYKILEKLGEGGMGVVYKAHDTTLDRDVALKFLPSHVSGSEQDKSRFLQEAQAAAALSHPNICTIYGIEEHDGQQFIVLQFVDGQMLQERKHNLPLKQALEFGIQIAEGLAAAHEKGIVHRDIKPENIMIRKDGSVQIMDFGLAKLRGATRLTKEGSTVGTAGYMSPEQVQGLDVDHRTDIFSLGVILYEMFAGESPFKGVHETAIAYEIVNIDPPPMASVKPDLDPEVDAIVLDCLAKDPADRYQSAAELARNLRRFKRESSRSRVVSRTTTAIKFGKSLPEQASGAPPPVQRYRPFVWPTIAGALAVSLAIILWNPWKPTEISRPVMRFSIDLPDNGYLGFGASLLDFSPDGKFIVYSGGTGGNVQLYLKRMDELTVQPISGTAGASYPAFSPDGQWIAYEVNGTLMKISVFGGASQKLCNVQGQSRGLWWANDHSVLFGHVNRGILRVSASGGEPEVITTLDSENGEISHRFPQMLPDGNTVIFTVKQSTITSFDEALIVAQRLDSGERKVLVRGGSYGRYVPTGYLMYVRGGSIFALAFDPFRLEITGQPVVVEKGGWMNRASGDAYIAFSKYGGMVFSPAEPPTFDNIELSVIDRHGTVRLLIDSARSFFTATISPDGKKLAVTIQAANDDIWIYHIPRKTLTRFTFSGGNFSYPIWSPDGKYVVYAAERGTSTDIFRKPWDGGGAEERLSNGLSVSDMTSYSPDGKAIAFVQNGDIWMLPLEGDRTPAPFLHTPASEATPRFSPDGRWLAYSSNESGRDEVYVVPFPKGSGKYQVSSGGGIFPLWTSDGKELCFVKGSAIMAVQITGTSPFDYSAQRKLVTLPPSTFLADITPDGQQFIIETFRSQAVAQTSLTVVLEWFDELKTRVSRHNK
jgi:serine/threonine protein kinase/Tol biopolymer transport system component